MKSFLNDTHKHDQFVINPYDQVGINHLVATVHACNIRAGWWDGNIDIESYATKIALIHSEASEMLEGLRKGKQDDHLPHRSAEEVECADLLIRLLDYAGARGLNLGAATAEKFLYNQDRADHKKENRDKEGGKKI